MVDSIEPTSPKNIVPRSLEVNRQEQINKDRPEIHHQHIAQNDEEENLQKQKEVNQTEEEDFKKIRDDKEESNQKREKREKKDEDKEGKENKKNKEPDNNLGQHIDIKI